MWNLNTILTYQIINWYLFVKQAGIQQAVFWNPNEMLYTGVHEEWSFFVTFIFSQAVGLMETYRF